MQKAGFFPFRYHFSIVVIFFATMVLDITPARAQDPLCDVALFNQMVERARLQGQRETKAVENLVYKPDSILEYTCYTRFVDHVPPNIRYTSIFFESSGGAITYTVTNDFPSDPMFDLSKVPADDWVANNFSHNFLGGRANPEPTIVAAGANYVCDAMNVVWAVAKCQQFAPEEPEDGFYGLVAFMSAGEIRRYPTLCGGAFSAYPLSMGVVPVMPAAIVYTSSAVLPTDCGVPVPTGQVITMPLDQNDTAGRPVTYNEKVCPNPTCTYVPTALNTGNCVP